MSKVIFVAGTVYQLFNAIIIRVTEKENDDCDLFLKVSTYWNDKIITSIKELNIFGKVYLSPVSISEDAFKELDDEEKGRYFVEPKMFWDELPIEGFYDEMFCGSANLISKLLYRYHNINGFKPDICLFEDGILSYTHDERESDSWEYLQNEHYGTSFTEQIKAIYLYRPELYMIEDDTIAVKRITSPVYGEKVKNTLLKVFGFQEIPQEKYIYFEDYFFADKYTTNDYWIFCELAKIVGRERIIVKNHPRIPYNRHEQDGWKIAPQSTMPWEIQLLTESNLENKVLISVSSTALLSGYTIFDKKTHIISLDEMYHGDAFVSKTKNYKRFMEKTKSIMNEKEVYFHTPKTVEEIEEVVRYIEHLGCKGKEDK